MESQGQSLLFLICPHPWKTKACAENQWSGNELFVMSQKGTDASLIPLTGEVVQRGVTFSRKQEVKKAGGGFRGQEVEQHKWKTSYSFTLNQGYSVSARSLYQVHVLCIARKAVVHKQRGRGETAVCHLEAMRLRLNSPSVEHSKGICRPGFTKCLTRGLNVRTQHTHSLAWCKT